MGDIAALVLDEQTKSLWRLFVSEAAGTTFLLLLGVGVCCNVTLAKSYAHGAGWLTVSFGWAMGVFVGIVIAGQSGAHLNPAITIGITVRTAFDHKSEFMPGVPVTVESFLAYIAGQAVGGLLGPTLAFLAFKKHFDEADQDPASLRAVFCTSPAIDSWWWNFVTEIITTSVLCFTAFSLDNEGAGWSTALGPLSVALVVLACGVSMGGPTGYAMNPVRDLGPRIAHALLPIPGKGSSGWTYAWIPVVGPCIAGAVCGLLAYGIYDMEV